MIDYKVKQASQKDLYLHLEKCNHLFVPPLSDKVNLNDYALKLFKKAYTFEAWNNEELVGLIGAYFTDRQTNKGFISNVSVLEEYNNKGIATQLLNMTKEYAKNNEFDKIGLEVNEKNRNVIAFYKKNKFEIEYEKMDSLFMGFNIKK